VTFAGGDRTPAFIGTAGCPQVLKFHLPDISQGEVPDDAGIDSALRIQKKGMGTGMAGDQLASHPLVPAASHEKIGIGIKDPLSK
jgi:hypothetical protein